MFVLFVQLCCSPHILCLIFPLITRTPLFSVVARVWPVGLVTVTCVDFIVVFFTGRLHPLTQVLEPEPPRARWFIPGMAFQVR